MLVFKLEYGSDIISVQKTEEPFSFTKKFIMRSSFLVKECRYNLVPDGGNLLKPRRQIVWGLQSAGEFHCGYSHIKTGTLPIVKLYINVKNKKSIY